MSKLPFASKSPKGKSSNGHDATGAMTPTHPQKKSGTGHHVGNFPTNAANTPAGPYKTVHHPTIKDARGR